MEVIKKIRPYVPNMLIVTLCMFMYLLPHVTYGTLHNYFGIWACQMVARSPLFSISIRFESAGNYRV